MKSSDPVQVGGTKCSLIAETADCPEPAEIEEPAEDGEKSHHHHENHKNCETLQVTMDCAYIYGN